MFGNFGTPSTFGAFSGSTPQTNVFGQPAQQQPGSLFGGGFNPPKPTFGSSFGAPATTSTMFGNNRLNNPTSTMFGGGQTATVSPFSTANTNQNQAGTSIPFNAITGTDTMMRNGVASPINTRHQCITCMKEYENKSLEELRLEDYQLNRKGPPQSAIFGGSQPQQSTSIFSSINANTGTPSTFGQANPSFGTPSTGAGLFSNLPAKPATSFFSNQTATAPFGGGTPAFSFSNPSSQPTSIFTSTNSTAGTLGTNSFTFQQPQQSALGGGLFGQKQLTPATSATTSTFGGFGTATMAKPGGIFSSTPTATSFGGGTTTQFGTGTGGMFGAQQPQQQKPFSFGTPFTSQPASTSAFGGTAAPAFNFNSTSTSAPTMGFGTTAPTFGAAGTGSTSFGSFGTTPNFSLGNPTTSSGFGAPSFSFTTPSSGMGFSAYNQSNNFTQPSHPYPPQSYVPFAISPYKDSPLFYNLITNRSLEELTKPTNPMAQRAIKEASRRRHSTSFNTTGSSSAKNFTFPVVKSQPYSKQAAIFDGFEDEPTSLIDILSPKSSVKRLSMKSLKAFEKTRYSLPSFSRTSQPLASSPKAESSLDMNNSSINGSFDDSLLGHRSNGDFVFSVKPDENVNESFQSVGDNGEPGESQGNGDAAVHSSNGSNVFGRRCNVICTRPGYFVRPSIEDLDFKVDESNNCLVKGFVIGRHNYGEIRFLEVVNVAGINVDAIVFFRHKEVVVYPDDDNKPPLGEGLNCAAEVVIERVWPIEKTTKDPIKSPALIRAMNYEDKLRRACIRLESEFISYNEETGTWIFRVKHFSKYNCDVEENEDEDIPPMKKLKGKGLGGIPAQQLGANLGHQRTHLQGTESTATSSTLSSMLMHKPWGGGDSTFSMETEMPVFHNLMSSTVAGKPHVSEQERDDYDYVVEGDIEHNPLTPSESEESDKDALKYDSMSAYESILDVGLSSPRVAHMKSMFTLFPEDEENHYGPEIRFMESSNRSKRQTDQFSPTLVGDQRPLFVEDERDDYGQGYSAPIFFKETGGRGAKSVPSATTNKNWFSAFQTNALTVTGPGFPPYKSKAEIPLLQADPEKSVFRELKQDFIPGLKRGCGRVSFLRNGQLLCVTNNKLNWRGSDAISGRVTIYGRECYDSLIPRSISRLYIETINKQMNIELSVRRDEGQSAYPAPEEEKDSLVVIPRHVEVLAGASRANIELDNVNSMHFAKLLHEYQVWNLCDILWSAVEELPGDPGSFFKQRQRLSGWFKNNRAYLFGWMDAPTENTSPLELLKYGMDAEACELAVLQGNYNLALLLSQRSDMTTEFCEDQIAAWEETGALEFIGEDTLEIFRIFSGPRLPSRYGVAPMTNREWLQNFAIHLWYSCPPTWSLKQVISSYLDVIHTQVDWCEEAEEYREENQPSNTNLFISLLKLYGSCDYPLKFILDSRRNNLGSLEYKLPFLLLNNLRHKGYIADATLFENVCLGFAGQLNTMGLHDWAIFVLQYLPYEANKVIINKALQSYIRCEDQRRAEHFLAENLDITIPQIFSLKAQHASFIKRPDHELWYSLKFGDFQEAYKIFGKKLFTICINCKQNESKVLAILDELYQYAADIPDWNMHGQLVRSYLTLQKIRDSDSVLTFDTKYVETNIKNFLTSFVQYKPINDSESAFLLELALSAQKMVALLVIDNKLRQIEEDNEDDLQENNLINLMKLPVPNEYMSIVQKFVATWMAV